MGIPWDPLILSWIDSLSEVLQSSVRARVATWGRRRKGVIRVGGRRHLRNGRLDAAKRMPALASPILVNQLSSRSLSGYTPCLSVVQYLSLNSVSSRIIA